MKKIFVLFAIFAAVLSCKKEVPQINGNEDINVPQEVLYYTTLTLDAPATKVAFDETDKSFSFQEGDRVIVYSTAIAGVEATNQVVLTCGSDGRFSADNVGITATGSHVFDIYSVVPYTGTTAINGEYFRGVVDADGKACTDASTVRQICWPHLPTDQGDGSDWSKYSLYRVPLSFSVDVPETPSELSLSATLNNAFALVRFALGNTSANDITLDKITLSTADGKRMSGIYKVYLKGGSSKEGHLAGFNDVNYEVGLSGLALTVPAGTGKSALVTTDGFLVAPGSDCNDYSHLVVTYFDAAGNRYAQEVSTTLTAGKVNTLTLNLAKAENVNGIYSAQDYEDFVTAVNAEQSIAKWVGADGEVNLYNNIASEHISKNLFTRIQKEWAGTFDGNNHAINQKATSVPLFTTITSTGVIKNLIINGEEKTSSYPATLGTSILVYKNYGLIENVTNNVVTDVTVKIADYSAFVGAGIAVYNAGTMKKCYQKGNMTLNVTPGNKQTIIGGIAAMGYEDTTAGEFIDCHNEANIIMNHTSVSSSYHVNFAMGGICGAVRTGTTADNHAKFIGCTNSGKIARYDSAEAGNQDAAAIGGILGAATTYTGAAYVVDKGGYIIEITNCTNTGTLVNSSYLTGATSTTSTTGARLGYVGGIAGFINSRTCSAPSTITSCTNEATISGGYTTRITNTMGGILGGGSNVALASCTAKTTFVDADNEAFAEGATPSSFLMGGLVGYAITSITVASCKVYTNASALTQCSYAGLISGLINKTTGSITVTGENKLGGSLRRSATLVNTTASNFATTYLNGGKNDAYPIYSAATLTFWDGTEPSPAE